MAYTKNIWKNGELPAINNENLNHIEQGIKEAHDNFINYKLKGDFAVINGEIECTTTQGHTTKSIPYPQGFTKENCVVISIGLGGQSYKFGYSGLAYGYSYTSPQTGILAGSQDRYAVLKDEEITFSCYNPNDNAFTYKYKIVLMKISEEES